MRKIKEFTAMEAVSFLMGAFLILCFFSLEKSNQGLGVHYYGPTGFESRSELNFWLAYVLFLAPGLFFLTFPFRVLILNQTLKIKVTMGRLNPREKYFGVLFLAILALIVARLGRHFVLLDYPVTDDEIGARLGGQILLSGKIMVKVWEPFKAYMHPFMFVKDGFYTSFESPGVFPVWALGNILGDESIGWSLIAAIPVIPIILIVRKYLSDFWAFFAGILYLMAPQAITLSLTTHAHLLTRSFLALAIFCFVFAYERKDDFKSYWFFAFVTGLGLITRPYEIGVFLVPFYLFLTRQIIKGQVKRKIVLTGLALGILAPLIIFIWYNLETTGSLLRYTRLHPAYLDFTFPTYENLQKKFLSENTVSLEMIWKRFGGNLSNNLLNLWIWFYAPLGFLFVYFGVFTNTLTRLLGFGILASLGLALFHDNYGVHLVGPINYSECVVALPILATFGIRRFIIKFEKLNLPSREMMCALVFSLFLGTIIFTTKNWSALRDQAQIHDSVYGFVSNKTENFWKENGKPGKAIILAKKYLQYWSSVPMNKEIGGYVYDWKIPDPSLLEKIIYLQDDSSLIGALREKFPDRDFFRLTDTKYPPYMTLEFLSP